ncbi:arginine N-methyltransferase 3 [Coprinopsis marcescibilis]|uniref:type I protein arginine methyltransferase n=1 Tax=Coprinopsis marcescibilis TaxID=230819 RepID=A0A5C3L4G7_COPMA|nr:arginine N-methyltransferase 3 [Coprinopsis marcescibilis]
MSVHLPPPKSIQDPEEYIESDSSSSESSGEEEETWDDWVSDSNDKQECPSLFDSQVLSSAEEAVKHDVQTHGFDLNAVCSKLALDFHGRVRLINYIRKHKLSASDALAIIGTEEWFSADEYLVPVLENDPLLQISSDDWSDSDDDDSPPTEPVKRINWLEAKLAAAQQNLQTYKDLLNNRIVSGDRLPEIAKPTRDDDTHYFQSYAENDIHAIMINDQVRTATYAKFILTTPTLFQDAVVLDVGCGTGILSLFAARAGAKRVIAVDASDIVDKAKNIVKSNGLEDIITVIRGKVEEITLPDGIEHVDVIISEWMGYALLYESMLDSVLHARDRFLRPGGVLAPSQSKMMLGLCDASELYKERVGFWSDVYGFDLSEMAEGVYDEAIIDVTGPDTLLSEPYTVKDILIRDVTIRQLDFTSPFTLVSTTSRRTKVNALVLYFDTFFTGTSNPVPPGTQANCVKEGDAVLTEVWPVGGRPAPQRRQSISNKKEKVVSFSTGPQSAPTHWKQTFFMLKEPFFVSEGTTVSGTFFCHKSEKNSRELNVEIHYSVHTENGPGPTVVQMYNVR